MHTLTKRNPKMARHIFDCIDAHTCGNPVRVIRSGGPILEGDTMSDKRQHFLSEYDWIRKGLMFEPRGHDMMSGSILYPPSNSENDIGILFIETSGCLPMCGHGTIGTVTVILQEGLVIPKTPGQLRIETPAGLVHVSYQEDAERVTTVKITNVLAFLYQEDIEATSLKLGTLKVDVAFGGNFYAIVDVQENFKGLEHYTADQLISFSRVLRQELNERYKFVHPLDHRIFGLSHILWTGATIDQNATARNAVFYGDKAIDRSPCGTGTSARMAQWHAKGRLKLGEDFIHESIIGSKFIGRIEAETHVGQYQAILPSVEGWARITGYNQIILDDDDPYVKGFQVI